MPVHANSNHSAYERQEGTELSRVEMPSLKAVPVGNWVSIGLVNNMPEAAFKATERQFISLLEAASPDINIRLHLYLFPEIPRTEVTARYVRLYSSTETLLDTQLDGLIVTGREPMTADLRDECYWQSFTKVLEWARDNTHSAVWSCLAAHAAILHMDGIGRRKSEHKHFGVFECTRASEHPLTGGAPSRFHVPHSRWNGLAEEDLAACGYTVLARTPDAGIDTFVKQENSLFVFFQGHPEYESDTLLREYRRDVERYFRNESKTYPSVPLSYFDAATEATLNHLRTIALTGRSNGAMAQVASVLTDRTVENTWHPSATNFYKNWLEYLSARKHEAQCHTQEVLA